MKQLWNTLAYYSPVSATFFYIISILILIYTDDPELLWFNMPFGVFWTIVAINRYGDNWDEIKQPFINVLIFIGIFFVIGMVITLLQYFNIIS